MTPKPAQTRAQFVFAVFLRCVGAISMAIGLVYWAQLIGLAGDPALRFDLAPASWKLPAAALAVLFPVAGAGLWMMVSWGPVVYVCAAAGEVILYGLFSEIYGVSIWRLAFHGEVIIVYVAFRLILRGQRLS